MVKVAVFPASSEVGMEVIRCLSDHKDIEVIGVDSESGPAKHICENYIDNAPWITDRAILNFFNDFDYVYPANEESIKTLEPLGKTISHPIQTILACDSKHQTYSILQRVVPVPEIYPSETWVKPATGHSGMGQYKHSTFDKINCEYLPGVEYTVDCFTQNGSLKYCQPRTRENIKTGISCKSETVDLTNEIYNIGYSINKNLDFTGAWFFQIKQSQSGTFKLLEIGARVAGSSGVSRVMGVNLPLLHLYAKMGVDVEITNIRPSKITRHLTVKAVFPEVSKIYFDWDDTIMIKGKINWKAIALAYKLGIECHILTRKENAQLIPPFQSIIISENKAEYSTKDTLLIDDSFAERKQWINALSPQQIDLYL